MRQGRWTATTSLAILLWAWATTAVGQQPAPTSADVQALLRRLEAAERRIQSLERERPGANPVAFPAKPVEVPAPAPEVVPGIPEKPAGPIYGELAPMPEEVKDVDSLSKQLDELKKKIEESTKKVDETKKITDSLKSDAEGFATVGTKYSTTKIVGRIHLDSWNFPGDSAGVNVFENGDPDITPQNRLGFRRIRFGVQGDVKDLMEYRFDMEFSGGFDVELRDNWIGFNDLYLFQTVLIGNQKRPYGLDHINSSRFNVFLERPFIVEAFNQDARRLGIQSYGVSDDKRYNWRFGVFNQRLIQDEGEYVSDHLQGEVAGRLAQTYWWDELSDGRGYAHFAVSGSLAHPDGTAGPGRAENEADFRTRAELRSDSRWLDTGPIDGASWYRLMGLEHVVNIGPLQVVSEYLAIDLDRDDIALPAGIDEGVFLHGGYVYVAYFLTGEHMPWDRETGQLDRPVPFQNFFLIERMCGRCGVASGWGAWQVAARLSHADLTDEDVFGGVGDSFTLGLNWYWNANARLQANYTWGHIGDRRVSVDDQIFTDGDYEAFGLRASVDF